MRKARNFSRVFKFRMAAVPGLIMFILPIPQAMAAVGLEFGLAQYAVPAGGSTAVFTVRMDGDTSVAGIQPVPNGLFSYGFVFRYDPLRLQLLAEDGVIVDPALDFSGFGNGALITRGAGFVAVKGNINPLDQPWTGSGLATIRMRVTGGPVAAIPLTLEIFKQTPAEVVFVDGTGNGIDPLIVPRASTLAILQPLRLSWIQGPNAHARINFGVDPAVDSFLQWGPSLRGGEWTTLPGGPHNSGEYLDFTAAPRRFYRLTVMGR